MRSFILLLFIISIKTASSQPFNFTTYREANGLPSGYIESAFEDSRGYLWLSTFGGLSRFDGQHFVNYGIKDGLPSNYLDFLIEDRKGRFWIATRKGISMFDGKRFKSYPYLPDTTITTYYNFFRKDAAGNIHFSAMDKLFRIEEDSVIEEKKPEHLKDQSIKNFILLANGVQAIAFSNKITIIYPDGKITTYDTLSSTFTKIYNTKNDPDGFYILGSKGVFFWKNGTLKRRSNLSFERSILTGFFVDSKNRIWVAAEDKGIKIINADTERVDSINDVPALVTNFMQDKQQTIWISTFRGLIKVTESFVTHYNEKNGLMGEDVRCSGVLNDGSIFMNNNLIVNGKLVHYSEQVKQKMQTEKGLRYLRGMALDSKNILWIFTYTGQVYTYVNGILEEVTKRTGYQYADDVKYDKQRDALVIANGRRIMLMKDGVIIDTIKTWGNNKQFVNLVSTQKDLFGNTWINDNNKPFLMTGNKTIPFFDQLQIPSSIDVNMIYTDENGCWFATAGYGAIHFKHNADNTFTKDRVIDKAHGLINDNILSLTVDTNNFLWVATVSGLCYVQLDKKTTNNDLVVHPVTVNEGIDIPNWNLAYLEKDKLNNIWLGVANGIYKLDISRLTTASLPPAIQIDDIIIANSKNEWKNEHESDSNCFQLPQHLVFDYDDNNITFSFKGINLKTGLVKYVYMLEGQDKAYITNQDNNSVTYSNLAPGKYTFKVKAINDYGIESDKAAEFSFTIQPPFWQTLWFRLLVAAICIALIYAFVKQRDKSTANKNELQLQMSELRLQAVQSQMNPHFIFNSLNSIQNFIVQNNQIEAARYLSKFSKLIRRILDNSHYQLLKLEDIVETLKMYVELEAFRFNKEFTYSFNLDTNDERIYDVELPPMLLQPFVENAILHGLMPKEGDKHLKVNLFIKDDMLNCIIEDNGVGRKEKTTGSHISRGEKLTRGMLDKGSIIYEDLKDTDSNAAGTKVIIQIPVTKN